MRIVLDTNVLVSAALKQKPCREWRRLWSSGAAASSNPSQPNKQLSEVVARPYFASLIDPDTRAG
jgi:predicted nucleic acid-binding protein